MMIDLQWNEPMLHGALFPGRTLAESIRNAACCPLVFIFSSACFLLFFFFFSCAAGPTAEGRPRAEAQPQRCPLSGESFRNSQ